MRERRRLDLIKAECFSCTCVPIILVRLFSICPVLRMYCTVPCMSNGVGRESENSAVRYEYWGVCGASTAITELHSFIFAARPGQVIIWGCYFTNLILLAHYVLVPMHRTVHIGPVSVWN